MRVAIVHDWLDGYRGGERVLEALAELFPEAPIYTLFLDRSALPDSLRRRTIHFSSGLNRWRRIRKWLLPFLPSAIESIDLQEFDLILSSSSCVAKGIIPAPSARHICYIHSPMRYVWDQKRHYLGRFEKLPIVGVFIKLVCERMRLWDTVTAVRVDRFIANSSFVAARVERYYGKKAVVVHPPVEVGRFRAAPKGASGDPYFLAAGAFVPYKRFDLAIRACRSAGVRLVVAGHGEEYGRLRSLAGGRTQFVLNPGAEEWVRLMANAQALLFPGVEDFGIIPVEAMAAGTPVLAFRAGGALDYVKPGINGAFFDEQTESSLAQAIAAFDPKHYDPVAVRESVEQFDRSAFVTNIRKQIDLVVKG